MPVKIAVIGAGSIGFTRGLMRDTLLVPELRDAEFRFMDINPRNLEVHGTQGSARLKTKTVADMRQDMDTGSRSRHRTVHRALRGEEVEKGQDDCPS
jgi:alpha-galactosidase/6-phospho-beta-glucosidase family protein